MNNINDIIDDQARKTNFSGVITISLNDNFIIHRGFGFRDRINSMPNQVETRFGIASGTKIFTALGILFLIEEKSLKLTTEVGEINPDFNCFIDPRASIEQLLTHTSGCYDYYDEELIEDFNNFYVEIPWYQLTTPSDYLPLFKHKSQKFKPGYRFSYSNGGYILLGIIIEQVGGCLFRDFIKKKIFQQLEMNDSGFFPFNNLPFNTAWGYLENSNLTNIYNLPLRGASDGGMYTTSGDLLKFWKGLFHYQVIGSNLLTEMITPRISLKENRSYGLGIYIQNFKDHNLYYLTGSDAGVGFDSACLPGKDLIFNILANQTNGEDQIVSLIYSNLDLICQF